MQKKFIVILFILLSVVIITIFLFIPFPYKNIVPSMKHSQKRITARRSKNKTDHFNRGKSFMQQENYEKAIYELKKVGTDDLNYVRAQGALGNVYYKMGNNKKAAYHWNILLKIDPDNKLIKGMLGNINTDTKQIHYDKSGVIKKTPPWIKKYFKAEKFIKEKNFLKARDTLLGLIKKGHKDFKIYFALGASYRELEDWEKVIESWLKAQEIMPDDPLIKELLPRAKKIHTVLTAIKNISLQIKNDTKNWKLHFILAKKFDDLYTLSPSKSGKGIKKLIIKELKAVLEINTLHIESYMPLIDRLIETESYDDAVKYAKKIVSLRPNVPAYKKRLHQVSELKRLHNTSLNHIEKEGESFLAGPMVTIPEGEFTMGRKTDLIGVRKNESPVHTVFLKNYSIDKYEVSNLHFYNFLNDNKHNSNGNIKLKYYPAVNMTWFVASAYCKWLGKKLPSEAQWEKAAKGKDNRKFPWGNRFINEFANTRKSSFMMLTPVAGYLDGKSLFGAYDMTGNAQEWTDSWYMPYRTYGRNKNESKKTFKVLRGGSYILDPLYSSTTSRDYKKPDYKDISVGFRCAKNTG